jgi:hypothetical protein
VDAAQYEISHTLPGIITDTVSNMVGVETLIIIVATAASLGVQRLWKCELEQTLALMAGAAM